MKKKIFFIVENSRDDPHKIFFEENKNSLFSREDGKYYFNSKFYGKKEIKVNYEFLKFDEILAQNLNSIVIQALEDAKNLSEEPIDTNSDSLKKLSAPIYSEIQKSFYETPDTIFHFIGNIFIKILMDHILVNGNKRFAITFLILSLRYFGYHFYWSRGIEENYETHQTHIEDFVSALTKRDNNSDNSDRINEEKRKIINWIKINCVVSIDLN